MRLKKLSEKLGSDLNEENNLNSYTYLELFSKRWFVLLAIQIVVFTGVFYLFEISISSLLTSSAFNKPLWLIAALFLIILCNVLPLIKMKHFYKYVLLIFFIALISRLLIIIFWKTVPNSDFQRNLSMAQSLIPEPIGNWGNMFTGDNLMYRNHLSAYMVFIIYETFILKILGNSIFSLLILNLIASSIACVFAALIAKKLFGKKAGIIAGMLIALNPTVLFYTTVLTNQHMATMFFLASLYVFINKPFKKLFINIILSAVLIAVSQLFRMEMMIIIVAIGCYLIYLLILYIYNNKKGILGYALKLGLTLLTFMIIFNICLVSVSAVLLNAKIINRPITASSLFFLNNIIMGLNQQSEGTYNTQDPTFLADKTNSEIIQMVKERLSNPEEVGKLILKKHIIQFGSFNYSWPLSGIDNYFSKNIYGNLTQNFMLLILILAFIAVYLTLRRRNKKIFLILLILLGYLIAFSFFEIQARYNYIFIYLVTIMASLTCREFLIIIEKLHRNWRKDGQIVIVIKRKKYKHFKA